MKSIMSIVIALAFSYGAIAQSMNKKNKSFDDIDHQNIDENNVALQGYDLTEYFTNNRAISGSDEFMHIYRGIKYFFLNEKNKELFASNPEIYLPQFGGYCAYGFAFEEKEKGRLGKYSINPESFKLTNGKLYLFYKSFGNDVVQDWNKDENRYIEKAERIWKEIVEGRMYNISKKN